MGGFFVRLIGYALLLGGSENVAQHLWTAHGLDQYFNLQAFHDNGVHALVAAAVICSLFGFGWMRRPAIFVAFLLAAAALTAPFALARVLGGS